MLEEVEQAEEDESKRMSYLVSALVHLSILLLLVSLQFTFGRPPQPEPSPRVLQRVRLVPPRVIPAPPPKNDRVSVGARTDRRQERIELQPDIDLTNEKPTLGIAGKVGGVRGAEDAGQPSAMPGRGTAEARGTVPLPTGPAAAVPVGPPDGGLRRSLENLGSRIGNGDAGVVRGAGGQSMGAIQFDPRGADFTVWVNHLRREVYRNWITPQPALLGILGHVDIEFVVKRDGTLASLSIVKGTGSVALDRAAANSLLASRLLPLPPDYGPDTLTINATFSYERYPQHS